MSDRASERAAADVAAERDDPSARLALMERLFGGPTGRAPRHLPFRRAALSVMRWQARPGLLNPTDAPAPGSVWWRSMNERLLLDGSEAVALVGGAGGEPHRELTQEENEPERFFMNVALARVLYAHALLGAPSLALGRAGPLGRVLGDPRLGMAGLFLSLGRVLPHVYPLDLDVESYIAGEQRLGLLVDYTLIVPRLQLLYEWSARDLEQPRLLELIRDGSPIYAWPFERRDVGTR